MKSLPRRSRLVSTAVVSVAAALAIASPASAGSLLDAAPSCSGQALSNPFLPWADPANYTLAPGGSFESASGWSVTGSAGVVAGNEPWNVGGATDGSSLNLPAGTSATSPAMCVGIEHPTLRVFAKSSHTSMLSSLHVEVLYEDANGDVDDLTIGAIGASGEWGPSAPMVMGANLLALLPGEATPVAFRFTSVGSASWRLDDVYVDPFARG